MTGPGKWDGDDVWAIIVLGVIAAAIGLGVWVTSATVRADGHVDHCYVDEEPGVIPIFKVIGHRSWRSNVTMAAELTSDAAEAKRIAMCPAK